MTRLCSDFLELSLTRAPGLLLWKTCKVSWNYRCCGTFWSEALHRDTFFRILHSELAQWLEMLALSLAHEAVHLYMQGIRRWLVDRDIPVRPGSSGDSQKRAGPGWGEPPRPLPHLSLSLG